MNNALDEIRNLYKPYRVTKKKKVTILDSTSGSFVVKEKENNKVEEAYHYLLSRNFDYFPKLTNDQRSDVNIFEYIDEVETPKDQKAYDMIDLVSLLHNKTTYYKEVSKDEYQAIYENLKNNITYTKNYYDEIYLHLIEEVIPSPSHYLLLRNIYKIFAALDFCTEELDSWYDLVKNKTKERVAYIHNNLETDHYIRNMKGYLISWEKSKIDSPILDLINFYQKEYMNLDFETIFKKYEKDYPLQKEEKMLLFLVLSIPPIIELDGKEIYVVREVRKKLDYVFKTEEFVKSFLVNEGDK